MSYQVFARKYRPRTFDELLGQEHVVRTLRNAIAQDRIGQAYLFVGPRGTGKTSTARILAKALNCPGGPKADFDPDDPVCEEIAQGRNLDVLEIDGASNNSVDQIRDLRETVRYAPTTGQYKIYYIDEVHMLSAPAFNALLKTLEEPPPHVKFIFATTEANKILPTIISRCQRFDLRKIPAPEIARHLLHIALKENVKLSEGAALAIAQGADGGMRDAQSMLDQLVAFCGSDIQEADVQGVFGFTSFQTVSKVMGAVLTRRRPEVLTLVSQMAGEGKDMGRLLHDLLEYLRHLLVAQASPEQVEAEIPPESRPEFQTQTNLHPPERLMRIIDILATADGRMKWASNKRLHLEIGLLQAVESLDEVSTADVVAFLHKHLPDLAELPPEKPSPPPAAVVAPVAEPAVPAVAPAPVAREDQEGGALTDVALLWARALAKIQGDRPLFFTMVEAAVPLEQVGNVMRLGFHPESDATRELLNTRENRSWLEAVLESVGGGKFKVELVSDPSLPSQVPEPAPAVPEPREKVAAPDLTAEDFYEDELIKEALRLFADKLPQKPERP